MKYNSTFSYSMVDTPAALQALSGELKRERIIGVDLESDSMYHYQEKVCLIQLSTRERAMIIDPLAIDDLSALRPLFARNNVKKVFHGADYDIRCLYRDFGIEVSNLLDTQIACMFLGVSGTSLDAVMQDRFSIRLNKKYQKKDWSMRPLPAEMLSYASMDVMYLPPLGDQLEAALGECNRLYWVEEECEILSGVRPNPPNSGPLFLKFKGAGRLDPRILAVLESLLVYRDKIAKQKNRPLFKVIRNASLMRIAAIQPMNREQLAATGELSHRQISMYGDGLIRAVKRGLSVPHRNLPVYPRRRARPMAPGVPKRVKALKAWRDGRSGDLGLDPALVCSNALAGAIAVRNPENLKHLRLVPDIRRWQIREFGKEIIAALRAV